MFCGVSSDYDTLNIEKTILEEDAFFNALRGIKNEECVEMPSTPESGSQDGSMSPTRSEEPECELPQEIANVMLLSPMSTASLLDDTTTTLPQPPQQMAQTRIAPKIDNVLTSIKIRIGGKDIAIDLNVVIQKVKNAVYNQRRFPGLILTIPSNGKTSTAFIFSTGTIMGFGPSVAESLLTTRKAVHVVRKVLPDQFGEGVKIEATTKILNIHATAYINYPVNIYALSLDKRYQMVSSYEPEISPSLVLKMLEPKSTSLIFNSGKIQILAKSEESIKATMELLETVILPEFRGTLKERKSCYVKKTPRQRKLKKRAINTQC